MDNKWKILKICLLFITGVVCFSCNNDKTEDEIVPQNEILNPDFEVWEEVNGFDKPKYWNTSNFSLYGIVTFNTVTKENLSALEGAFCPKLVTKSQIIDNSEVKVAGLLTLGNFDINIESRQAVVNGGIPFVSRPVSLEGYYKYAGVGIDSCFIDFALTKFKASDLSRDTVASARFSSASIDNWTSFSLPIRYSSNETPDSMNIIILSSDTSIFENGSTLWIDNLSLKY
jgi:hypothetical protein